MEWWEYVVLALACGTLLFLFLQLFRKEEPDSEEVKALKAEIASLSKNLRRSWVITHSHGEMGDSYGWEDIEGYEEHNKSVRAQIQEVEAQIEDVRLKEKEEKKK